MRTPHTSTYKGKMVGVKLRDGRVIKGKFYSKRHDRVLLGLSEGDRVEILIKDMAGFMIIKGN
jgi:translation initiation factor IF-1